MLRFKSEALFRNHEEVLDISEVDPEAALQITKQRAGNTASKPTGRCTIEISSDMVACFIYFLTVQKTYS